MRDFRTILKGRSGLLEPKPFPWRSHCLLGLAIAVLVWGSEIRPVLGDTLWTHNGSIVRLQEADKDVSIIYETPSKLIQAQGVVKGTLLFNGTKYGEFLLGTARRFKSGCAEPYEYPVSGQMFSGGESFVLWGKATSRDRKCLAQEVKTDELVFNATQRSLGRDDADQTRLTPANVELTKRVLDCYRDGAWGGKTITIREMRLCVGAWITPRALLHCSLGGICPAIPDTPAMKATIEEMLTQSRLTPDSPLVLQMQPELLPAWPTADQITGCNHASATKADFETCAARLSRGNRYDGLLKCSAMPTERGRLACFAESMNNANLTAVIGCVSGGNLKPEAVVTCTPIDSIKADAERLKSCIRDALSSEAASSCISNALPQADQPIAKCLTDARTQAAVTRCLVSKSASTTQAAAVFDCMATQAKSLLTCGRDTLPENVRSVTDCFAATDDRSNWLDCANAKVPGFATSDVATAQRCLSAAADNVEALACVGNAVGGDTGRVATCVSKSDRIAAGVCLLGQNKEVAAFGTYYSCVRDREDLAALLENCTNDIIDPKTSKALACAYRAGGDTAVLASCAAAAVLPEDAARLAGCATTSTGVTSFALCAAGPAMNEEWRIAAECAMQSGGNPVGFAGCTAGRLTMRELTNCFRGGVGTTCFGPNNTLVVGVRNAFKDIFEGPGKNNDIVVALDKLGELTGGDNSVFKNPDQLLGGPNSLVRNPGQIWGGDSSLFNKLAGGNNSDFRKVLRGADPSTWRF